MAGRIELITGPMGAGKTTEMLRRRTFYDTRFVEMTPLVPSVVLKSNKGYEWRKTHDSAEYLVQGCDSLETSFQAMKAKWHNMRLLVAIDEVQFFPPDVVPIIERAAREWGWTVICAGLDYDFRRYEFSTTWELRKIADVRIERFAMCAVCGERADVTQRLHLDGTPALWDEPRVVLNDGSVRYEPRCWKCHQIKA